MFDQYLGSTCFLSLGACCQFFVYNFVIGLCNWLGYEFTSRKTIKKHFIGKHYKMLSITVISIGNRINTSIIKDLH